MTEESLDARLNYLMGIAERDAEQLIALQSKAKIHAENVDEFNAWKDAKEKYTAEQKKMDIATLTDNLQQLSFGEQHRIRQATLSAETEDIRLETLAWNEAKRSQDRETRRKEREHLRTALKERLLTNENEQLNQAQEKKATTQHRQERAAWAAAKDRYKTKETNAERKRLVEVANLERSERGKNSTKKKKSKEANDKRNSQQAKYEMLRAQRKRNAAEGRKRLADQNVEREKRLRLIQMEKKKEIQRKKEEREIKRAEARAAQEQKRKEIATKSRRLRQKNELTLQAKRDAALLVTRRRRESAQKSRDSKRKGTSKCVFQV